jgi:hypothetical protein
MSFKDTFTRGDSNESKLQYDDTAFNYFFIAVCVTICIPLGINLLLPFLRNPQSQAQKRVCPCNHCQQKGK